MRKRGNIVAIRWLPASEGDKLLKIAKENAREATHPGATPEAETPRMRSTTLNVARSKTGASKHLPEKDLCVRFEHWVEEAANVVSTRPAYTKS
jgi:hypothetical protein